MPDSPLANHSNKNIILVGFMGCGKSTVGRIISQQLNYPLLDTDQYIEEQTNSKISDIFKQHGEDRFRDLESDLVKQLLESNVAKQIISTGGGLPLRPENRENLKSLGYVVWLKADINTIFKRTAKSDHRPLLNTENPKQVIADMLEQRNPIYKDCSHLTIQTDELTINDTVHGIIESARYFFSNY